MSCDPLYPYIRLFSLRDFTLAQYYYRFLIPFGFLERVLSLLLVVERPSSLIRLFSLTFFFLVALFVALEIRLSIFAAAWQILLERGSFRLSWAKHKIFLLYLQTIRRDSLLLLNMAKKTGQNGAGCIGCWALMCGQRKRETERELLLPFK